MLTLDHKNYSFEVDFKSIQEDERSVKFQGLASTFGNLDLTNDIVQKGAFLKSLKRRMPKLLLQHNANIPIGKFVEAKETSEGLFVRGQLTKGVQASDEAALLLKDGVLDSMSIGYNVIDFEVSKDATLLKELDLFEISLVTFPANPEALVSGIKRVSPFKDLPFLKNSSGDPDTSHLWDSSSAIKNIKSHTDSEDSPSSTYRNAFLYFEGDGSKFSDYKLPIADVIDSKLLVIPRGLFSAAAAVSGARGGVDLPPSSKSSVIVTLNKYYLKMGLDSPFNKSGMLIINSLQAKGVNNKREFEKLLRESGCFSKSAATLLAAHWSFQGDPEDDLKSNQFKSQITDLKNLIDSYIKKS